MATTYLLVHPPLLGPALWQPMAELVRAAGDDAVVADLRPALTPADGWARRAADLCAAGTDGRAVDVLVGHSGAGALLPLLAGRCGAAAVVFVDAVLPLRDGPFRTSAPMREFVAGLRTDDGALPVWSDWWPPGTMAELVPDDALRARIEAEQVRLPAAFYDEAVPVPAAWPADRAAYLQLSPAYEDERAEAADRGWPTAALPGLHLHVAAEPDLVLDALGRLVGAVRAAR